MSSVDVIVPCYRYGHFLRECVQSVLTQARAEVRVLIIDDESPDNTPEVEQQLAREDSRVTYRRHSKNMGHIATYNEGIDWVQAQYFLLLSADDYLLPGALARATELMEAHPRVGMCYGQALEIHPDASTRQAHTGMKADGEAGSLVIEGLDFIELCRRSGSINLVPTPTAVVRTDLQKRLAGYRPELPHSGDLELWLRLAAHGTVGFIAMNQAVYRRHSDNMSLAYIGENRLADLHQREAAIDWFCRSCLHVLPNADAMKRALLEPLAHEAVGCASSALNGDKQEDPTQFSNYALCLYPGVTLTTAWFRLLVKRRIGRTISQALLPSLTLFRPHCLQSVWLSVEGTAASPARDLRSRSHRVRFILSLKQSRAMPKPRMTVSMPALPQVAHRPNSRDRAAGVPAGFGLR